MRNKNAMAVAVCLIKPYNVKKNTFLDLNLQSLLSPVKPDTRELHRFKPYRLESLAEIFDLFVKHSQIYIFRIRYTLDQYMTRTIPMTFWDKRLLFALNLLNYAFLFLISPVALRHRWMIHCNLLFESAFGVKRVDIVYKLGIFSFVPFEIICY